MHSFAAIATVCRIESASSESYHSFIKVKEVINEMEGYEFLVILSEYLHQGSILVPRYWK